MPPCTTKRKTTTNLKTKNNQNWQKMELCGSLTTKELKKKHSSRPVGGVEMGSWAKRTLAKLAAGGPWQARKQLVDHTVPHLCGDKPGGTTGEQDRLSHPGFQCGKVKPQNL